jgi:hypothetical protein
MVTRYDPAYWTENINVDASAVDRVHTVLHGYLIAVCEGAGIAYGERQTMVALLRKLEAEHPSLADLGPRAQDIKTVLNSSASILDALLPVRNQGSIPLRRRPPELEMETPMCHSPFRIREWHTAREPVSRAGWSCSREVAPSAVGHR